MPDASETTAGATRPFDGADGMIHEQVTPDEHIYDLPYIQWADDIPGQNAYPSEPSLDDDASESEETALPEGWRVHIHPNGSLYYENEARRLTSNYDLRSNPAALAVIIHRLESSSKLDMREDHWEIYLGSRGFIWIDHQNQSASTPGQDPEEFTREIDNGGIVSQLKRQHRYWTYIQSHPNHVPRAPLQTAWQEAHDALVWCHAERVLFQQTNATFSREDSKELLEILTRLKDVDLGSTDGGSAYRRTPGSFALRNWFMAAVLRQIAHDRLCTHHGQPDAPQHRQREADDMNATHEDLGIRLSILYYVVGTALFLGIPHSYHRRILSVDKTDHGYGVNSMRWKAFVGSMLKEWTDSNLLATVLISATVGFLAIPGIEDNSRLMGLFAVLLAIGSVLVGMLFIWHHQPRANTTAEIAVNYFRRAKRFSGSPVPFAFILSVPIVLLLWSFLCFVSAILIFAFRGWQQTIDGSFVAFSKATSPGTVAMLSLVVGSACVAWIFMWRVWTPLSRRASSGILRSRALHPLQRMLSRFLQSCTPDVELGPGLPPPGGLSPGAPTFLPGLPYRPSPASAAVSPKRPSSRASQRNDEQDDSPVSHTSWAPQTHPHTTVPLPVIPDDVWRDALPYALDSPEIAPVQTVTAGRRQPDNDTTSRGSRHGKRRRVRPSSSQSSLSSITHSSYTHPSRPSFSRGRTKSRMVSTLSLLDERSNASTERLPPLRRSSTNDVFSGAAPTTSIFKPRSLSTHNAPRDSDSVLLSALGAATSLLAAPVMNDSPRHAQSARRQAGSRSLPSSPWARSLSLDHDDESIGPPRPKSRMSMGGPPPVVAPPASVRQPKLKYYVPPLHRTRSQPSLSRAPSQQDLFGLPVAPPEPDVIFIRTRSRPNSIKMQSAERPDSETEDGASSSRRDDDDDSTISQLMLSNDDEDINSLLIGPSVPMDADLRDMDVESQEGSEEARALDPGEMV